MSAGLIYVDIGQMSRKERELYIARVKAHLAGEVPKESRTSTVFEVIGNALSMLPWAGML